MHLRDLRRASRRGMAVAALLTLPLALASCGSDDSGGADSADGTTTVTVGVIPIIDVAPIYLGIDQGFFEDEGLEVKLELAQGGAAIVPGVMSGQYQFGFSNSVSLLLAESQGLEVQAVTAGVASTGKDGEDFGAVMVPGDSDIKSAADLAGKKIAVNTLNNINTVTINEAVRADGGDPSGIEYVELPFPDIAPAIASGDVDAGQLVEPFVSIAAGEGDRQVSSNYVATDPELMVGLYFTSSEYADDNPEVVEAFTTAMEKSLAFAQENSDEARAILSEYTDLDPALQEKVVLPSWPTEIGTASIEKLGQLMAQDGLVESEPDTSALLP